MVLKKREIKIACADSTGFEARHVSQYFLHRKWRGKPVFARFHPKLNVICDCQHHLIIALIASKGPFPDAPSFKHLLTKIPHAIKIDKLLADAGYDSENNHRIAREEYGVRSFFPPLIGRPTAGVPTGKYRRLMHRLFKNKKYIHYGQRWQVETVFSMIKRTLGTATRARTHHSRRRELALIALTHNLAVVLSNYLFYRAVTSPFIALYDFRIHRVGSTGHPRPVVVSPCTQRHKHL